MNTFIRHAHIKGANVLFMYPSYPLSEFQHNQKSIEHLDMQFQHNLNCSILCSPKDFVFPDNDFFDTAYHLNELGKEKRTEIIIELLRTKVFRIPNNS